MCTFKHPHATYQQKSNGGFSLVEAMVGLAIGMIGMIIILQTLLTAERQKNITTGAGDAQTNGALAIYAIQRDARQGAHSFNALNALGCSLTLPSGHTLSQLGSVIINPPATDIPAGDANTDSLLIAYGNGDGATEGDTIKAVTGPNIAVGSPSNYRTGQNVFVAPMLGTAACPLTLTTVGSIPGSPSPNITLTSGIGAIEGGSVFNLGTNPKIFAYAIRNGNLTVCDYMAVDCSTTCTATNGTCNANWVAVASNIVSLRAQYGRDTSGTADRVIDVWDQTTPANATPSLRACEWARIPVVRIVIVARSANNGGASGASAPNWDGNADAPITLPSGWQSYRHRAFETVIPLRNMPWMENC